MNTTQTQKPFYSQIFAALKGEEFDYTEIPLKKSIWLLSIPMIIELMMESTFAVVDMYFVGQLGPSAVSTVGLTEIYIYLIYAIGYGMAMGVTAIIARRTGEKDTKGAQNSAVQSILLAFILSLPLAIAGIFFPQQLLGLMGADDWALNNGYPFMQWMLGTNVIITLLFVINSIFRGAGDAVIAMWVLLISNLINIALDPILIFGLGPIPAMGLEGAAKATVIGRGIGVLIQFYLLFKGSRHIRLQWNYIKADLKLMIHILKTCLGGIGQMFIGMLAWAFLQRILSDIGTNAVAASTIVIRIMMFTLMPAWGFSNAAATLVGQNLGAEKPDRAEKSVWQIGIYNMIFLIVVSIFYFFFNEELMRIFTDDPEVIRIGAEWIQILSYSYFLYGWWMVSVQAFNGAGDTITPTWINFIFFWLIQLPLAYLMAIFFNWSYSGVFWAVLISETAIGIFTLYLFSRGKWKNYKV
ncbi:MAG: MATE family efflux transporter [Bacteroidota bacterium]